MKMLKNLFNEKCPICREVLISKKTSAFDAIVIKSCPQNHYQKEFHPAIETSIESYR